MSSRKPAPKLEIVEGADGGAHLVGTFKGATLEFASVNASQVHAARVAQGLGPAEPDEPVDEPVDESVDDETTE